MYDAAGRQSMNLPVFMLTLSSEPPYWLNYTAWLRSLSTGRAAEMFSTGRPAIHSDRTVLTLVLTLPRLPVMVTVPQSLVLT